MFKGVGLITLQKINKRNSEKKMYIREAIALSLYQNLSIRTDFVVEIVTFSESNSVLKIGYLRPRNEVILVCFGPPNGSPANHTINSPSKKIALTIPMI